MSEDWSFAHLKTVETLWGPHGYHRYPAKFIPQLVRRLIESYSVSGQLVGDPFLGSATTGVEALRTGRRFWGGDINPVALLISRAKCIPIRPDELAAAWQQLDHQLDTLPRVGRRKLNESEIAAITATDIATATDKERFTYWFPAAYRESLDSILQLLLASDKGAIQNVLLCGFSNILKRCSIWLSGSTKAQKDLSKVLGDPVEEFRRQMRDMLKRNNLYWDDLIKSGCTPEGIRQHCTISLEDTRKLSLPDDALDLLVTSPPYATCYEYKEIHQLTQLWFERYHLLETEVTTRNWIGSKGVSHRATSAATAPLTTDSCIAERVLTQLAQLAEENHAQDIRREVQALRYYFQDMSLALREMARVTAPGKYMVLVIGDSYKRGLTIPTSRVLCEMALQQKMELVDRIVRKIPVRVLVSTRDKKTGRFSSTAQSDTRAYPEEYILVFKKTGKHPARSLQSL